MKLRIGLLAVKTMVVVMLQTAYGDGGVNYKVDTPSCHDARHEPFRTLSTRTQRSDFQEYDTELPGCTTGWWRLDASFDVVLMACDKGNNPAGKKPKFSKAGSKVGTYAILNTCCPKWKEATMEESCRGGSTTVHWPKNPTSAAAAGPGQQQAVQREGQQHEGQQQPAGFGHSPGSHDEYHEVKLSIEAFSHEAKCTPKAETTPEFETTEFQTQEAVRQNVFGDLNQLFAVGGGQLPLVRELKTARVRLESADHQKSLILKVKDFGPGLWQLLFKCCVIRGNRVRTCPGGELSFQVRQNGVPMAMAKLSLMGIKQANAGDKRKASDGDNNPTPATKHKTASSKN
ncbi:unnamed protein product [Calypogeia fissa]